MRLKFFLYIYFNMFKVLVLILTVLIIILIGNIYITREGFGGGDNSTPTSTTKIDTECSFDESERDENCNMIEDPDTNNSFLVHNVCPKDPKCLGICINDHTWTDANKRALNYTSVETGVLKNEKYKHLINSSRCSECIKNFYQITKLIGDNKQCSI